MIVFTLLMIQRLIHVWMLIFLFCNVSLPTLLTENHLSSIFHSKKRGKSLKITLAFFPHLWRIPQVCCGCGRENVPLHQIPLDAIEYLDSGRRYKTWYFNFPYCNNCSPQSKKGTSLFSALKGEHAPVEANFVLSKKYGKLFRKKKAQYLEFTFKNDSYGKLFKEANENFLFDKYFEKLKDSIK
jgi:hypothetical protein